MLFIGRHDIQHTVAQPNDTQHNGLIYGTQRDSINSIECHVAEYHYTQCFFAECHYAQCHGSF